MEKENESPKPERLLSLDTYRGLVMFALALIYTTGLWLAGLDLALLIGFAFPSNFLTKPQRIPVGTISPPPSTCAGS